MSINRGMTLLEILAVVVILGLLAATLTVGLSGKMGKARHEIARTQIAQISAAVETFKLERRRLPTSSEGIRVLADNPSAPYFLEATKLVDPWDRPYLYLTPGPDGFPFEILTYGGDGQPGGENENADLSSTRLSEK